MRRRWWVIIGMLSGLLLVVAIAWPEGGPSYQGTSLRVWLKGFDGDSPEGRWRSADAVRHMGTNAVPFLIYQLSHGQHGPTAGWKVHLQYLLDRQSLVRVRTLRDERGEALAALDALGPDAKTAVPALEGFLHEKRPDQRALLVLAHIGPAAVPALSRALTNDERLIRLGARACMDMMQAHSELLFPQTPQDAEFTRQTCLFNSALLQEALKEYKSQHPEQFQPDNSNSMPPQELPLGFIPAVGTRTNKPAPVPAAPNGFE